jgi:hypothetical protein
VVGSGRDDLAMGFQRGRIVIDKEKLSSRTHAGRRIEEVPGKFK